MKLFPCFVGAGLVVLASCGEKKEKVVLPEDDSTVTVEMESPEAGPEEFYLDSVSIGPVKVGEKMADLPDAVANLYDVVTVSPTPDANAYTYLLGNIPQFTIYEFMDNRVDVISLEGNARGVLIPGGDQLRVGDEFSKVLGLPGVKAEWQGFDEEGIWYWKWRGLYFGVDESEEIGALNDALCDGQRAPKAALFTPKVKIGYIATGLPF